MLAPANMSAHSPFPPLEPPVKKAPTQCCRLHSISSGSLSRGPELAAPFYSKAQGHTVSDSTAGVRADTPPAESPAPHPVHAAQKEKKVAGVFPWVNMVQS